MNYSSVRVRCSECNCTKIMHARYFRVFWVSLIQIGCRMCVVYAECMNVSILHGSEQCTCWGLCAIQYRIIGKESDGKQCPLLNATFKQSVQNWNHKACKENNKRNSKTLKYMTSCHSESVVSCETFLMWISVQVIIFQWQLNTNKVTLVRWYNFVTF